MIFFNWGEGAPDTSLGVNHFSARWSRTLSFDAGIYRFNIEVDDGFRLFIDGVLVLDEWEEGATRAFTVDVPLSAGSHSVQIDYFERTGVSLLRFWWDRKETFSGWKGGILRQSRTAGQSRPHPRRADDRLLLAGGQPRRQPAG